MDIYLKEVIIISEICEKVYVIWRAIDFKLVKLVESEKGERKKKSANGRIRQDQKLKEEIKELRKNDCSKTNNELNGRRQQKKATKNKRM